MPTNMLFGIIILVAGVVMLGFGLNASNAPMEQLSETVTGRYTDMTMWYLIVGAAAACGGVALMVFGRKT
ncbi:DUF3185 family protein [Ferrovibrio terrae]|uniref:DUF3185 family protein n=1 Tax=Ferrovibrio terrae TaxID=2594003 RepID=UPI003137F1B8